MEMGKIEIFADSGIEVIEAPSETIYALQLAIHYARNEKRPRTLLVGSSTGDHEITNFSIPPNVPLKFTYGCCLDLDKAESLYQKLLASGNGQFLIMKDGSFAVRSNSGARSESVLEQFVKMLHGG